MANIILYGTPISTYVRTVRLLLAMAKVDYELKDIGIFNGDNQTEEYLSKHPFGKVPALEVDGSQIYETDAITTYLNEGFAGSQFSPSDLLLKTRMIQIISIVDKYLYAPAISTLTIENLVKPSQGKETDQQAVEAAITPAKKAIEAIEGLFSGEPYLLSSELTLADFHLIPIFVYISKTPQFAALTANTPKLNNWWKHTQALDVVKEVCG